MTAALLARSSAFARIGGVDVAVLTFDARPDTPQLEARLRDRGVIAERVRLVNLYDWLRTNGLPGGSLRLDRDVFTPLGADEATEESWREGRVVARVRRDPAGHLLQIDHLREDGTLVLSDRRDARQRGVLGGRSLVLCDGGGRPVRSWRRSWTLYTAWLDALVERQPSFMIVDSKTIAPFMLSYRRSHVVTAHVVHASHRAARGSSHPVRSTRRAVFEHLDDFDLVVVLSRRQAAEVVDLVGPLDHLVVIPNAKPATDHGRLARSGSRPPREAGSGIVLASLTRRKRVADAIAAFSSASRRTTTEPIAGSITRLTLDIYGEGEEREVIEDLALRIPGAVLHGFEPDARRHLERSSFLLLTSRSEGFPLVLVEAMAVGCIPIAYDIRYGPADLIRDGRNGFLVPDGDTDALASAIVALQRLPARRVEAMRRAAVRSARAFDERRVVTTWARHLSEAQARRELRRSHRWRRLRMALQKAPFGAGLRRIVVRTRSVTNRFGGAH